MHTHKRIHKQTQMYTHMNTDIDTDTHINTPAGKNSTAVSSLPVSSSAYSGLIY